MEMIIEVKKHIMDALDNIGNYVYDEDTDREVEVVNMQAGCYLLREHGEFVGVVKTLQQVYNFFGLNN